MKNSISQENIVWQAAHTAVNAAVRQAEKLDVAIAAAVVDRSGNLVSFLRMEKGPYLSIDIAIDKAYTAASFSIPTSQWETVLPKDSILRQGILNRPRFIGFGGGVPIVLDGECIGAIGVSGATEEQDEACANAGINAINQ